MSIAETQAREEARARQDRDRAMEAATERAEELIIRARRLLARASCSTELDVPFDAVLPAANLIALLLLAEAVKG